MYIYICMKHTNINYFNVSIYILYTYILCRYAMIYTINTKHVLFCWIGYTCSFFHTDSSGPSP